MKNIILFRNTDGQIAYLMPTSEAVETLGIGLIAMKDVPVGQPYKVVDSEDFPTGVSMDLWEVDDADLDDGLGAPFGAGTDDVVIGYDLANGIVALRNETSGELKAYNINMMQFMEVVE
jgi:hypothetical protein